MRKRYDVYKPFELTAPNPIDPPRGTKCTGKAEGG